MKLFRTVHAELQMLKQGPGVDGGDYVGGWHAVKPIGVQYSMDLLELIVDQPNRNDANFVPLGSDCCHRYYAIADELLEGVTIELGERRHVDSHMHEPTVKVGDSVFVNGERHFVAGIRITGEENN